MAAAAAAAVVRVVGERESGGIGESSFLHDFSVSAVVSSLIMDGPGGIVFGIDIARDRRHWHAAQMAWHGLACMRRSAVQLVARARACMHQCTY